jgi:hydroxymethylpyrimidine pyrophosphatase-like HAD family hydrolase
LSRAEIDSFPNWLRRIQPKTLPGEGQEELKALADAVTVDCGKDDIGQIITKFFL